MIPTRTYLLGVMLLTMGNFKLNLAQNAVMPAAAVNLLIQEATALNTPFTSIALTRIQSRSSTFGQERAARSTDIVIFNKSQKTFRLELNKCSYGGFSKDLFPEHTLPKQTSTVFGIQSTAWLKGVSCSLDYRTNDGISWFSIVVKNSYRGSNSVRSHSSEDLQVLNTDGSGNNNQVRFVVDDKTSSNQILG